MVSVTDDLSGSPRVSLTYPESNVDRRGRPWDKDHSSPDDETVDTL